MGTLSAGSSCSAKYILKDCTCLTNPLDYYSNICGYVNKQNGLVYPCDPGCCSGKCETTIPDILSQIETRQSAGISLPAGFGDKLPQSDEPTPVKGATPIDDTPAPSYKVWQIVLIGLIPLLLALVMSFFLT
jgi:hypothetical protein